MARRYIRIFILSGLVFSLCVFNICADDEDIQLSIILQWYPQSQFAGFIMAREKGFFKENGLDVSLSFYDDKGSTIERMVRGEFDFATVWLSQAITYRADNTNILNIFQLLKKSSLMLVAKAETNLRGPEDLHGRCISIWAGDFSIQPFAFFRKFQIEPELIMQSFSIELFLSGACEVTSAMYYNEYNKIYQAGYDRDELITFFFADYGLNFPEDGIYCTVDFYSENAPAVHKFIDAVQKGWKYAFNNTEETIDLVIKYSKKHNLRTNRAQQAWMLKHIKESFLYGVDDDISWWGGLCEKAYYNVAGILVDQGLIDKIPDYSDFHIDLRNEK